MLKSYKFNSLLTILNEENELNCTNFIRMIKAYNFKNNELVNEDGDLYLTVDSLIRINNLITGSGNIHLRQINVKAAFHNRQYMDYNRIEPELHVLVDKFNERQITARCFCNKFLDEIHPFSDGNSRTCKILFEDKYRFFLKWCLVTIKRLFINQS